nr:putative E3 ubiquitin-protein ligase XBAT35 isoform X1 [Ipomoea batatas]
MGQDFLICLHHSCFREKFGWLFYHVVPEISGSPSSWSLLCMQVHRMLNPAQLLHCGRPIWRNPILVSLIQ